MGTSVAANRWLYPVLFGAQTVGALVLFGYGVPHYRQVLANPAGHEAELETLAWALPSIVLIQVGYWLRHRLRPPLPQFVNGALGHVVLFLGRFSFVFASGVLTFVFIVPRPEFSMPAARYVITMIGVFSIFCYILEVER
jgi:hypothetical protein